MYVLIFHSVRLSSLRATIGLLYFSKDLRQSISRYRRNAASMGIYIPAMPIRAYLYEELLPLPCNSN